MSLSYLFHRGAHGITSDVPVSESVEWVRLVDARGELTVARRGEELLRLVLGGYGLFGVVYEVGMLTSPNIPLSLSMMPCSLQSFPALYKTCIADRAVDVKLARLDVVDPDKVTLFVYRRAAPEGVRTVSKLGPKPHEMSVSQRLMYKWLAPTMREARGLLEAATGAAADWSDALERNSLLFESAQPLAELWSPIADVDDTFVLQVLCACGEITLTSVLVHDCLRGCVITWWHSVRWW